MTIRKRIAENPPKISDALPLLLTERETAAFLGVSLSYLRKSRSTGAIKGQTPPPPFIKIDGKVRYRRVDLLKWVSELVTRKAV